MSDDQLGWDQILKGKAAEEAAKPEAAAKEELPAKPKKARAKKASTEPETSFAKKDWSSLESELRSLRVAEPKSPSTSLPTTQVKGGLRISTAASLETKTELDVALEGTPEPAAVAKSEEPTVLSVSDLNRHIRDILEGRFPLLWLKAEISNFKAHTSGHFYFSLKDAKAQISAVMFRGFNSQLRFRPEDGMEVLVRGKITVYEPRGNYQIFCEMMEPVGAGALQKAYEQLKAKLQREGLFDASRKRPLPLLPKHIAIVTSPTGAAIRDMLNVLGRRFKGAEITIIPCKVQGDAAPREIVAAIGLASRLPGVDVMIIGRGGGSIEDLWAFNDERVARAIAASPVPTISAVGHEVDFTIADFVADLRAPTPSAAAELVVKSAAELIDRISALHRGLRYSALSQLAERRRATLGLSKRLIDPQRRLQDAAIRCDELLHRLELSLARKIQHDRSQVRLATQGLGNPLRRLEREHEFNRRLELRLKSGLRQALIRKRDLLTKQMAVLDSLSPLRVLDRGYSMVKVGEKIITNSADLQAGDSVEVKMSQGSFTAKVIETQSDKKD